MGYECLLRVNVHIIIPLYKKIIIVTCIFCVIIIIIIIIYSCCCRSAYAIDHAPTDAGGACKTSSHNGNSIFFQRELLTFHPLVPSCCVHIKTVILSEERILLHKRVVNHFAFVFAYIMYILLLFVIPEVIKL